MVQVKGVEPQALLGTCDSGEQLRKPAFLQMAVKNRLPLTYNLFNSTLLKSNIYEGSISVFLLRPQNTTVAPLRA